MSGVAINFLALGITGYVFIAHYGDQGTPGERPERAGRDAAADQGHRRSSATRSAQANLLTWVALLLVPLMALYLFRTPAGPAAALGRREAARRRQRRASPCSARATWP